MCRFGGLLLLICLSTAAQEPPKARDVLGRVAKTYRQVTSYRVEAVITNRMVGGTANLPLPGPARDEIDVAFQTPDLLRVEHGTNPRTAVVFPRSRDAAQYRPDFGPPGDLSTQGNEMPSAQGQTDRQPDPR